VTAEAVIAAVAIGALTTNILVVNNYRDVETDRVAGKRTLVVRFGRHFARTQFASPIRSRSRRRYFWRRMASLR